MQLRVSIFLSFFIVQLSFLNAQYAPFNCEAELVKKSVQNGIRTASYPAKASTKGYVYALSGLAVVGITMTADESLQQWITSGRNSGLDQTARFLAEPFGNPYYAGGATLMSYIIACHSGHERWAQVSSDAFQSVMISSGITLFLKAAFHRHRPREQTELDPYVFDGPSLSGDNLSFPSGHTTIAFALATSLSLSFDRWYYSVPLYGLATLTAWERIYNFEHWPSDVMLGAAIGSTVGWLIHQYGNPKIELVMSGNRWGGSNIGIGINLN